ncbi:hypothetical protein IQ07DRAFT_555189 [Pyrenochaeta sp. DS3sAY3a]|nr:hypothetical protein IQ07DRAFT_555189 [Pyrenochaeta sp. DS3sAY3a]
MAPFRNRDRSNRSARGQIEHNVLEGLPINQYREVEITIGPSSVDNKPVDKDAWPELPMPRDSQMLPEHSQQLLRAARSGRIFKPPAPPEDDNEMKDEEEENKEVQVGFAVKKYIKVARHLEAPEPEYLAKRRKGLPSPYTNGQVVQPLRETKIKKLDADGNVAVYKVLVPEGQAVEGEVAPTDAAIEVAPATAVPGTVVEGLGVVNAEGVVVANDILQQTPPRRRPPPPKKKMKRAGPGRGKKRVVFAEGAVEQGTPASNTGSDLLALPGLKQEDGSVAPSDGGDTPMADAGAEDEEGSGEEGSDDDDNDVEMTSAPATPARSLPAPTSAPSLENAALTDDASSRDLTIADAPVATLEESSDLPIENTAADQSTLERETTQSSKGRDASSSPDLPLSAISHSRQNSLNQIPVPAATDEPSSVNQPEVTEVQAPQPDAAPILVEEPVQSLVQEEALTETSQGPVAESLSEPIQEPEQAPILEPLQEHIQSPLREPGQEPNEPIIQETDPKSIAAPVLEPEPVIAPAAIPGPEVVALSSQEQVSAPPSEPDLLGSLERQLEKDSESMADN